MISQILIAQLLSVNVRSTRNFKIVSEQEKNLTFKKSSDKGGYNHVMEKAMICWGIWFMIVGLSISSFSLYASYHFSWSCLTEFFPGMLAFIIGVHMLKICRQSNSKSQSEITDSNRESPFYYELEPSPPPRSLPPIPRDIGRDYDPIIQDKV